MTHEDYMREALALARECLTTGDVPVGCVVISPSGEVIGRGRNRREELSSATRHAEVEAIEEACRRVGSWRLAGCSIYVTLEPCPMCAGAIWNARISHLWYGAREERSGCCGSVLNLFAENIDHATAVRGGLLAEECAAVLGEFFREKRQDAK